MVSLRIAACILGASLLLAGCRTSDTFADRYAVPEDPGAWSAPPRREEAHVHEKAPAKEKPKPVEEGARMIFGAWAIDGRVNGRAEGAPGESGMDASGVSGYSLETRFLSRGEDPEEWGTTGFLLEHFRNAGDRSVPGGRTRTEGALTGLYFTVGGASGPYRDGTRMPEDFHLRWDLLLGVRRGFVKAEVPDGSGGTYRKSSTWPELAIGLRAEWSPVRRAAFFVRGDAGTELTWDNAGALLGEGGSETSGLGGQSYQFLAGLRVRPAEHVSVVVGWRYLHLDGREITYRPADEVDTADATWSGPWAGLEVDF